MPQSPEPVQLPRDVLERVGRVYDYHQFTKHTHDSVRAAPPVLDWANQPNPHRVFEDRPRIELPRALRAAETDTLDLLRYGSECLPEPQRSAPQTIATLAAWLYLADGITVKRQVGDITYHLRTCPSAGALYPFEIYVAAFGVKDLEPGLYHYSPWGFQLRKLREGEETLSRIKRGRPDLEFLKTVPAALLVSTIFWRSAWKYRDRGYRYCLLDSGHLVQNLVTAAAGLGISAMVRLRVSDANMRELIGVPEGDFGDAEAVQATVIWADKAEEPQLTAAPISPILPPIPRPPLSSRSVNYAAIVPTHQHCTAPGMVVAGIRPPITELTAMPPEIPKVPVAAAPPEPGAPLGPVMIARRSAHAFGKGPIEHRRFIELNWLSFRGGTYSPMEPDGPHVATVRPFWFVNAVTGLESGIWYYDPVADAWSLVRPGDYRAQARYLALEQGVCKNAAAVCFMLANLGVLMSSAGPDAYRLAHIEAGIVGQRIYLACGAMGLACTGLGAFYDDDLRRFLGLVQTGWEGIYAVAIGEKTDGRA